MEARGQSCKVGRGTDPHPGNILVAGGQLGLIDFGQVCEPWSGGEFFREKVVGSGKTSDVNEN